MPSLSDFDHYKIETDILEDGKEIVNYEYVTNARLGLRNAKFEQRWYRQADIGQGSPSDVWLEVQRDSPETKRAVKVISKRRLLEINVDYTRELKALTEFSKPKYRQKGVFVDFLGWWDNLDSVFLAMEYFPIGTLEDNISSRPSNVQVIDIMVQLLEGLEIMHAEGFAHRDLKPGNIFVVQKGPKWWVKIGDFGISKRIQNQNTSLRTFTGTHDYMAPEFFGYVAGIDDERSDYTHAVDIWALGCVVYKLWTRTVPFSTCSNLRPLQRYCSGRDPFPVEALMSIGCTDVEITIIKALLNVEPSTRPSAKAALDMVPYSAVVSPAMHYSLFTQVARSRIGHLDQGRGSASGQAAPVTLDDVAVNEQSRGRSSSLTPQRKIREMETEPEQAPPTRGNSYFTQYESPRRRGPSPPLQRERQERERELEQAAPISRRRSSPHQREIEEQENELDQAAPISRTLSLTPRQRRRQEREMEPEQAAPVSRRPSLSRRSSLSRRLSLSRRPSFSFESDTEEEERELEQGALRTSSLTPRHHKTQERAAPIRRTSTPISRRPSFSHQSDTEEKAKELEQAALRTSSLTPRPRGPPMRQERPAPIRIPSSLYQSDTEEKEKELEQGALRTSSLTPRHHKTQERAAPIRRTSTPISRRPSSLYRNDTEVKEKELEQAALRTSSLTPRQRYEKGEVKEKELEQAALRTSSLTPRHHRRRGLSSPRQPERQEKEMELEAAAPVGRNLSLTPQREMEEKAREQARAKPVTKRSYSRRRSVNVAQLDIPGSTPESAQYTSPTDGMSKATQRIETGFRKLKLASPSLFTMRRPSTTR